MSLIAYPASGYNSFVSNADASEYFEDRLNSGDFLDADPEDQDQALITALRALQELDVTLDLAEAAQLKAIKEAQCEQALHELHANIDEPVRFLSIPGMQVSKPDTPRFSDRALGILRPYIAAPTLTRTR
jgi:hypothetical protein